MNSTAQITLPAVSAVANTRHEVRLTFEVSRDLRRCRKHIQDAGFWCDTDSPYSLRCDRLALEVLVAIAAAV